MTEASDRPEQWVSVESARSLLRVSKHDLNRMVENGEVRVTRVGMLRRFAVSDIARIIGDR